MPAIRQPLRSTQEQEDKKQRRKEQNRLAQQRCREKQRQREQEQERRRLYQSTSSSADESESEESSSGYNEGRTGRHDQFASPSSSSPSSSPSHLLTRQNRGAESSRTGAFGFYSELAKQLGEEPDENMLRSSLQDEEGTEAEEDAIEEIRTEKSSRSHGKSNALSLSRSKGKQKSAFVALGNSPATWAERLLASPLYLVKVYYHVGKVLGLPFDLVDADEYVGSLLRRDYKRFMGIQEVDGVSQASLQMVAPAPFACFPVTKEVQEGQENLMWSRLPDEFHPSELSAAVPHHIFVDLSFPWPSVRNKILVGIASGLFTEYDLCSDVWCGESDFSADPIYYIYGDDPLDVESYEVTEKFVRDWGFLLDASIIKRTNWWRRQRGLSQLILPQNVGEMMANIIRRRQSKPPLPCLEALAAQQTSS